MASARLGTAMPMCSMCEISIDVVVNIRLCFYFRCKCNDFFWERPKKMVKMWKNNAISPFAGVLGVVCDGKIAEVSEKMTIFAKIF